MLISATHTHTRGIGSLATGRGRLPFLIWNPEKVQRRFQRRSREWRTGTGARRDGTERRTFCSPCPRILRKDANNHPDRLQRWPLGDWLPCPLSPFPPHFPRGTSPISLTQQPVAVLPTHAKSSVHHAYLQLAGEVCSMFTLKNKVICLLPQTSQTMDLKFEWSVPQRCVC